MNVIVNLFFFFLNKLNIHTCNGIYIKHKENIFTYLVFTLSHGKKMKEMSEHRSYIEYTYVLCIHAQREYKALGTVKRNKTKQTEIERIIMSHHLISDQGEY